MRAIGPLTLTPFGALAELVVHVWQPQHHSSLSQRNTDLFGTTWLSATLTRILRSAQSQKTRQMMMNLSPATKALRPPAVNMAPPHLSSPTRGMMLHRYRWKLKPSPKAQQSNATRARKEALRGPRRNGLCGYLISLSTS